MAPVIAGPVAPVGPTLPVGPVGPITLPALSSVPSVSTKIKSPLPSTYALVNPGNGPMIDVVPSL